MRRCAGLKRLTPPRYAMLEKIFGKKSTGVVYIVCAGVLLLSLIGAAVLFLANYPDSSLYALFVQVLVTAFSLAAISAPVFIQKKFKYFIPPFIEISLCVYSVLLFLLTRFRTETIILNSFLPAVGGFILSSLIFAVFYSALARAAEKKHRRVSPLKASLLTWATAFALMLALAGLFALANLAADVRTSSMQLFMAQAAHFVFGSLLFCITGYFSARSHKERFRIYSFKDPETAERYAVKKKNKALYTVVRNISKDRTDYKKALSYAKTRYYFIRILHLTAYAAYTVHACITFSKLKGLGYAIGFALISSFVFTAIVYVYEYILYRKNAVNQRLRKLKIAKAVARCYSLALLLAAMYVADYNYNKLSGLFSVGMLLFNLCLMIYNIFGKPRYYPSAKKSPKNADNGETGGGSSPEAATEELEETAQEISTERPDKTL